ncbi:MAG: DUF3868 domain-containing protein [Rikenellaceae bacterium]
MNRYIIVLFAAFYFCGTALSQVTAPSILGAKVQVHEFEYRSDSVTLSFEFNFDELQIGVNESVIFRPVIHKESKSFELPTVVVKRRGGAKAYDRATVLGNRKSVEQYEMLYGDPYQVVEYYGSTKQSSVPYSVSLPYDIWMFESELSIDCVTYGCCNSEDSGLLIPSDNMLKINIPLVEIFEVDPQVELIKPEKVAVKRRDIQYSSALIFKVNSTYIDPSLAGNSSELESIDQMMQSVLSDPDYTITGVNITGFASPEGSLAANMKLSQGRASALESLMTRKYKTIGSGLYNVKFGGENWDKLYELVSQSDDSWKDRVLSLIDGVSIEDGRESKLMALDGGVVYKYLLKNVFPSTRLVVVDVEYNIDAYDLDRIAELIDLKPENLSLEEMYRLSETYGVGDPEFEQIFLTAARIYPFDEVALNNALVAEIKRGDISSIEELVGRVNPQTQLAELANSMGAYYLLAEDYQMAQYMLERALDLGSSRAQANLDQLSAKLDNLRDVKENEDFRARIYGR